MVAALMDLLDGTIVNVALPTIQRGLGASPTQVEWVVSGYMLAFAATLITAGRLGDLFGRRRLFLVGVVGFGVASLLSGLAQTPSQLVVARIAQGAAAAVVAPQVLASFRTLFTGRQRLNAFAAYGAVGGLAAALGVILGGLLTQADLWGLGWRAVFLVNVPVVVAVLRRHPAVGAGVAGAGPGSGWTSSALSCWRPDWSRSSTRCWRDGAWGGRCGASR